MCATSKQKSSNNTFNVRDALLLTHSAKLFNALPRDIRNLTALPRDIRNLTALSVDKFKNTLDKFLQSLMNLRFLGTLQQEANTNSIVDMIYFGDHAFQVTDTRGQRLEHSFFFFVNSINSIHLFS